MTAPASTSPLSKASHRRLKRAFDLILGVPIAIVFAPLLLVLVIAVKVSSRGPAFFTQERVGRDGRPLVVYKLRTMHRRAEQHLLEDSDLHRTYRDQGYKLETDPRITRLGRHLRRCSLDEVPQIYQVLLGQMSLVGPRPVLAPELENLYRDEAPLYVLVRPGLTGAWQVSGRSTVRGRARVELDVAYVCDWSLGLDLKILARTVPTVLSRRGAV